MIPYIINVSLILAGCLAFYKLLLQKETFYRLNRYVLLACLLIAFSLPFVRVPQQLSFRKAETMVTATIDEPVRSGEVVADQLNNTQPVQTTAPATSTISFEKVMTWLVYLYWFGVIVFAFNFLTQVAVLLYRAYTKPVIVDGAYRIVEVSGDKAPCSFANNIFINPEKYEWETYNQILLHEKVHIQQKHSLDLLIAELMLIFQWFNPFAWIYRKEVENNLEFLTDDHLVQHKGVERSSYQLSLLKVSAPHFPLSLTTNYNQSLLKKRIAMMNTKKSNVHTAWKYFFLLPLLVLFATLFNEPAVVAQDRAASKREDTKKDHNRLGTEGIWMGVIKDDHISMRFKQADDNDDSFNGSTFKLSEFSELPRGTSGTFTLKREAGTMEFTGKFEGNDGMGRYKFITDKDYMNHMNAQGIGDVTETDIMTFFLVNVKRETPQMLKKNGYKEFSKHDLIAVAALKVDEEFVSTLRKYGYNDLSIHNLISMKALNITGNYISELQEAGYKKLSASELVSFKAQGIDKAFLTKIQSAKRSSDKDNDKNSDGVVPPNEVISLKALKIDDEYLNSIKATGLTNISNNDIISMKSLGVTPEYIRQMKDMGLANLSATNIISMKGVGITPEFIQTFRQIGYKDLGASSLISMKAVGVTPEYIKTLQDIGYSKIGANELVSMKAQDVN
ncbi:MAG TPA: M56 family metallopeptidase, partial [Chitinophagaceae bacterium]